MALLSEDTAATGVLLVLMEPPASLEEEFNDWYDTEHFPQRCSLPGFLGGTRWICTDGWPRWAALYPLVSSEALQAPEYLAVSGKNGTPWSRRILPRTIGRMRVVGRVLSGGDALPLSSSSASALLLSRFPVISAEAASLALATRSSLVAAGATRASSVLEGEGGEAENLWSVGFFDRPISAETLTASLGRVSGTGATLFNVYRPYSR